MCVERYRVRDRREIDFSIGGICMQNYCRPVRISIVYRTIEPFNADHYMSQPVKAIFTTRSVN